MIKITQREFEIIEIIKKNPFVSQQEIAEALQITRSSVAVHITNLTRKGIIRGRGYVVDERDHVSVIGGANMDIVGYPFHELKRQDSNPGGVKVSLGGVGRNIAENLARLGTHTKMFTVVGADIYGDQIIKESEKIGIDMSHVKRVQEEGTGTYLAILDHENDMDLAIASMNIFKKLDRKYLEDSKQVILKSQVIVFDTNLEEEIFRYGVDLFKENDLFLDTVSHTKALRAKSVIGAFHTIKPNRLEAEALSGIAIQNHHDLEKACGFFHAEGVKNVFITLGPEGVFYSDGLKNGIMKAPKMTPKNATGAGDAFQAALVYSELHGFPIKDKVRFAIGASVMAMNAYETINPDLSESEIRKIMKKVEEMK